jgi:hypothetical protein
MDIKAILAALSADGDDEIGRAIAIGLENAETAAIAIAKGGDIMKLPSDEARVAAIGTSIALMRWKLDAVVASIGKYHPNFAALIKEIEDVTHNCFDESFTEFTDKMAAEHGLKEHKPC